MRSMKPHHATHSGKSSVPGPWGATFLPARTTSVNDNSNVLKAFGGGRAVEKGVPATEVNDAASTRAPEGWTRRLRGAALSLWAVWRREMDCARSIRELEQLDDRSLRDIGIGHRSDIEYQVRHGHTRR